MSTPHKTPEILHATVNWETSRIQLLEQSERKAWIIAQIASGLAVISWLAIVFMMPLKETIPYVIRVDSATGVPDVITTLKSKEVSHDEVMNKFWLAQYVRARETYDWFTLQKDYETVGLFSSEQVGAAYASLFSGKKALNKQYGDSTKIIVEIISIVPGDNGIGTVRFSKRIKRLNEEGQGIVTKWIATIAYEYLNPSSLKESERLQNPFGFQVVSYRIDPEMVTGE